MAETKNKIGMFNKGNRHSPELNYQPNIPFQKVDQGGKTTPAKAQPKKPVVPVQKEEGDQRKTLRIPKQQYFELNALLELSQNKYIYEMIAELVDEHVQRMSQDDADTLRAYQDIIARQQLTEQRKRRR